MKGEIRLPADFISYYKDGDDIYSNWTKEINYELAGYIRRKPIYAYYTARDFLGKVWWDETIGYWGIEIWKFKSYRSTHIAESLEELIEEVRQEYGTV